MHNGTQRARRRRRLPTFAALLVLIGAVCFVAAGGASGEGPNFTATPLTPDSTFSASKSPSANLAQTDPVLLGRTDASPVNVMIKYDFDATASYTGDLAGLAATSPAVTGVPLDANTGAVAAYDNYAEGQTALITQRGPGGGARGADRLGLPDRLRRRRRDDPGEHRRRAAQRPGRRSGPAGHAQPAAGRQHVVHRRDDRLAVARRVGQRRQQHDDRRDRHRHLAGAPDASPPGVLGARRRPEGLPVRRRQRRRAPRPDVRLQQQADRRVREDGHLHGQHRHRRPGVLQRHHARVLAARPRGSRHAHGARPPRATASPRPCSTASSAARSAASRPEPT